MRYQLTGDTTANAINADGSEGAAHTLASGTALDVAGMSSSDVLAAMAKGGNVSGTAPDGTHYSVPAASLTPAEAISAQSLYLIVGVAVAIVAFMYWNNNRK